jgi:hypothetical protein
MVSNEGKGKFCGVCFMIFWCTVAFSMGFMILSLGAPFPVYLIPFGMGLFGIFMCIAIARGQTGMAKESAGGFTIESADSTYEQYRARAVRRDGERILFQVPSRCPECDASISQESVDWVGPLQAECPYCHTTIDVEKKTI